MRREIVFQIEGQRTQKSFADFRFFVRKAEAKAPVQRRAGVFRGDLYILFLTELRMASTSAPMMSSPVALISLNSEIP